VTDSTESLQERITDQIQASADRCVAARSSIVQSAAFIEESRASIARSRIKIGRANSIYLQAPVFGRSRLG
jgi:hypothetical protein